VDALRDHSSVVILVFDGDLSLGIRAEPSDLAAVTSNRETFDKSGRKKVSKRHHLGGLVSSIAKHVALVTGTNVLVLAPDVDTTGDVGRLLLEANHDVAGLVVKALARVVEANALDGVADDLLVVRVALSGDLTEDHDHAGLGGSLTGDLGVRILSKAGIEDSVRDLIADLVRVALVDGLRSEEESVDLRHDDRRRRRDVLM
jgi:hypothetical protein